WNERHVNIHSIIDATPTRNATFYLAKLTTVSAICMTIITLGILTAIGFQFSQGHFDIKPHLYLSLYYYAGMPLVLTATFALFMQPFAKNRAIGLVMGASILIITQLIIEAGLAHPLTLFSYNPDFVFSDMADTLYHATAFNWFSLYWASFCAILAVFGVKHLHRGYDKQQQLLTPTGKKLLATFALTFVASGSYIFYQVNVFNSFTTRETRFDIMEQYERDYSQYKDMAQPTVIDVKLTVDIYPEQNRYDTKGLYIIENQTKQPIDTLLVGVLKKRHNEHKVYLPGATLEKYDELHNKYFFKLEKPLLPGQKTTMDFELSTVHSPFAGMDPEHYVTKGGSYFEMEDVVPQFGFFYDYVMSNEEERKKRGLSLTPLEKHKAHMQKTADDWIQFETTVSTSLEQTAVTPGNLEKSWVENNRRYF
ncbi:MAG: ABC transporter permease, partial [Psychrosphaera sp.]|nr:ABC transporter permease [Psychrosphaera sp.]